MVKLYSSEHELCKCVHAEAQQQHVVSDLSIAMLHATKQYVSKSEAYVLYFITIDLQNSD